MNIEEAGARHSGADMSKIQAIHDHAAGLGAACMSAESEYTGIVTVSEAAALRMKDSHDALRQQVTKALAADHGTTDYGAGGPYVRDMFDDQVVYDHKGKTLKRKYSVDSSKGQPKVMFMGDPQQVDTAYVASNPGAVESKVYFAERKISKDMRDELDSADFAGKNKSFPIAKPEDVAAAAASIGRAGSDNYSNDELKSRIIAIAKRKGAAFVAKLPDAWKAKESAAETESAAIVESAEQEFTEVVESAFIQAA